MKKLCFVIPRAYYLFNPNISGAEDKVGGAQKQAYLLSIGLAEKEKFNVNFLVADLGQPDNEEIKGVKIWKSFNFSDNIFKRTIKFIKTIKKINAETYIFRSADIGVAFAIFYIKTFLKKKVLYMIASDVETTKKQQIKHSGKTSALAMQYVYNKSDIITAQASQQAYSFEQDRKRKPNAIIKNIYSFKESEQINHQEKNTILWVGRLGKIKNPQIFINLANKFSKEKFVMIAPIVRDYIEYGEKIQNEARKVKNLKLVNYVKPTEINEYFKNAKIYVLTSELEGFSNTMAEAMMSECAVLSYNVNPDNILNVYECGFCANNDTEKFLHDFEKLNSDSKIRIRFGKNGANYIKKHHNKESIIENFANLLNKI